MATHEIDLVISDAPVPVELSVQAYNHLMGESNLVVFGSKAISKEAKSSFPDCLGQMPVFMPTRNTMLRREIDRWLDSCGIRPNIRAEFEDSALKKVFAQNEDALIFLPSVVEEEVVRSLGLDVVARVPELVERIYLISLERRIKNPFASLVISSAKEMVFN